MERRRTENMKIIVQAGGKGSRLEKYTFNKPKALVSVNNKPMLFHLFEKFPLAEFIIIGDYKFDVLEKYLDKFAMVKYKLVKANEKGTCSGIKDALGNIDNNDPFMIVWSDLLINIDFDKVDLSNNFIGISKDFECRWSFKNGRFEESRSYEHGVAGVFIFRNKADIETVPRSGEFVRWLQGENVEFLELPLHKSKEFGLKEVYEANELKQIKTRPFNKIVFNEDSVIKVPNDDRGKEIALKEKNWYRAVVEKGYEWIPDIYSYEPFEIERIKGNHCFSKQYSFDEKHNILKKIVSSLKQLHDLEQKQPVDLESVSENYRKKTYERINSVKELIPFIARDKIMINGILCDNVFKDFSTLDHCIREYSPNEFSLIHGDCTFSNIIVDKNSDPFLIDPRGYFGKTLLYGDEDYDWAKLFYSIVGNYDQFNNKLFKLEILDNEVVFENNSNGWSGLEECFFELIGNDKKAKIKFLHSIIWLSLTSYVWDDYDSICGAFYNGLLQYHIWKEEFKEA